MIDAYSMASDSPRRLRILFIEDDPSWQQIGRRILLDIDNRFLVRTASAAEAAIEVIGDSSGFDVIISDYFLDGTLTGLDVYKFCTAHNSSTPFLILSGRSIEEIETALGSKLTVPVISKNAPFKEIRELFAQQLKQMSLL